MKTCIYKLRSLNRISQWVNNSRVQRGRFSAARFKQPGITRSEKRREIQSGGWTSLEPTRENKTVAIVSPEQARTETFWPSCLNRLMVSRVTPRWNANGEISSALKGNERREEGKKQRAREARRAKIPRVGRAEILMEMAPNCSLTEVEMSSLSCILLDRTVRSRTEGVSLLRKLVLVFGCLRFNRIASTYYVTTRVLNNANNFICLGT